MIIRTWMATSQMPERRTGVTRFAQLNKNPPDEETGHNRTRTHVARRCERTARILTNQRISVSVSDLVVLDHATNKD